MQVKVTNLQDTIMTKEKLQEILLTIPEEVLAEYGIGSDSKGTDEPKQDLLSKFKSFALGATGAAKRVGSYTYSDECNSYYFGHSKWNPRYGNSIRRIIPHHMAGNLSVAQFDAIMYSRREMSPTVAVFSDGTAKAYVPEEFRPWTTGGWDADCCSLTLEIANDGGAPNWHISDKAYNKAVAIMADWCARYKISPVYKSGKQGTIQMHKEWAATACPGPYLTNKIVSGQLAKDINNKMNPPKPTPSPTAVKYRVQSGAFKTKKNAVAMQQKLKNAGFQSILKYEGGFYKVQDGVFDSKANAEALSKKINAKGIPAAIVEIK